MSEDQSWDEFVQPENCGKLIDAKIIGPIENGAYMKQSVPRGEPGYVMSRSELKLFSPNPRRWRDGYKEGATPEKLWGSMVDCLLFTPKDFAQRFTLPPVSYEAKAGKKKDAPMVEKPWNSRAKYCREWKAEQEEDGNVVIGHEEAAEAKAAVAILLADKKAMALIECSQFQVLVECTYSDFATGVHVPLKSCVDIMPDQSSPKFGTILADLKTTQSISPSFQDDDVGRWWSDAQGSLYCDMVTAAGQLRNEFRHILQESYPPYAVGRRYLSAEYMERGKEKYMSALKLYAQCLATGKWPSPEEMATTRDVRGGFMETKPNQRQANALSI